MMRDIVESGMFMSLWQHNWFAGPGTCKGDEIYSWYGAAATGGRKGPHSKGQPSSLHYRLSRGVYLFYVGFWQVQRNRMVDGMLWETGYKRFLGFWIQFSHLLQVPLKPEPKECTKAEPFQLESLVRHQEEQQRQAEERAKAEQIEAALKEFHACPNLSKYSSSSSPSWLSLNMSWRIKVEKDNKISRSWALHEAHDRTRIVQFLGKLWSFACPQVFCWFNDLYFVFFFVFSAPAFIPVKSRKPLTEVQEFNFHVDHRAVERAEFDLQVCNHLMWNNDYINMS